MRFNVIVRGLLTLGAALASGHAAAQVTNVVLKSTANSTIQTPASAEPFYGLTWNSTGTDSGWEGGNATIGGGWAYSVTSTLTPDFISFRNGGAAGGLFAVTKTTTTVDITFRNDGASAVVPTLNSTILPAGMGLFVAPRSCLDGLTGCTADSSAVGDTGFNDFTPGPASEFADLDIHDDYVSLLAGASFDFKVIGNGANLYSVAGDVALTNAGLIANLSEAAAKLDGFRITSPAGSSQEYGVQWDATNFTVDFGSELGVGESATLRYEMSVTSFSNAGCLAAGLDPAACLLAYGSFGDPIGRGGGSDPDSSRMGLFADPNPLRPFAPDEDAPIGIDTFKLARPTFNNGVLTFALPVPEPASWALMLTGMALVGGGLRRRKAVPALRVH